MAELDGRPVSLDQLQTLALTNYGHFTSLRVDHGRVRGLSLHLDRLARDCRALFGADLDTERVRDLIRRMAPARGATTIRVTVFDPTTDLAHPDHATDPQVLVTHRSAVALPLPPLRVQSSLYVRDSPEVKSVGLFGLLHHRRAAQLNGFDDALFVDGRELISEGGTWNIGFFDGDQVIWPDADCLAGVTMRLLQKAHEYQRAAVSLGDLASMEAAFATNAAIGVRAITRIDRRRMPGDHPVIDILRMEYMDVDGEPI
ncbi:aminotransferase class IV family protein [Streptomyces sp. ISL-1]|uniref:aminotransferase class IV family protein n=1 Tax=Streptomyces sp. ISL-1 TaxID=2817657 RepID=UPI001BE7B0C2|nr:aminotransferase class IV family protein [Streptomyces sp. ISL-1]MBT2387902.1 aminotransferase class IV family protein [Streptomyces sp. ISL-1]